MLPYHTNAWLCLLHIRYKWYSASNQLQFVNAMPGLLSPATFPVLTSLHLLWLFMEKLYYHVEKEELTLRKTRCLAFQMKFSFSSRLRCGWAESDFTLAPTPITLRVNESPRAETQLQICRGAPWSQGIFSESTRKQLAQKKGKLVAEQGNNVCSDNKRGFVKECRLKLRAFLLTV